MINNDSLSIKGREECHRLLSSVINYLCHEMDSNHRIPYDKKAYDYLVSLSYEIDRELGF